MNFLASALANAGPFGLKSKQLLDHYTSAETSKVKNIEIAAVTLGVAAVAVAHVYSRASSDRAVFEMLLFLVDPARMRQDETGGLTLKAVRAVNEFFLREISQAADNFASRVALLARSLLLKDDVGKELEVVDEAGLASQLRLADVLAARPIGAWLADDARQLSQLTLVMQFIEPPTPSSLAVLEKTRWEALRTIFQPKSREDILTVAAAASPRESELAFMQQILLRVGSSTAQNTVPLITRVSDALQHAFGGTDATKANLLAHAWTKQGLRFTTSIAELFNMPTAYIGSLNIADNPSSAVVRNPRDTTGLFYEFENAVETPSSIFAWFANLDPSIATILALPQGPTVEVVRKIQQISRESLTIMLHKNNDELNRAIVDYRIKAACYLMLIGSVGAPAPTLVHMMSSAGGWYLMADYLAFQARDDANKLLINSLHDWARQLTTWMTPEDDEEIRKWLSVPNFARYVMTTNHARLPFTFPLAAP